MFEQVVESEISKFLNRKARKENIPIDGTFELTPCCNMNCRMCYVRLSKEQQEKQGRLRTVDEWLELAKDLKDKGLIYLLLTGGEPFLIPDLPRLLEGLNSMGFVISINSNATLINEETIEWLKKNPPVRINVTLYGSSNETYQNLCQNPRGFDQVTKALDLLKEAGINVKLNCSLTPENKDDLKDIIKFAADRSIPLQVATYMFPPLRKDQTKVGCNNRFTAEEASYYAAKSLYHEKGKDFFDKTYQHLPQYLKNSQTSCIDSSSVRGDKIRCGAGKSSFWIDWKGNLHACGMFPEENNNVFEVGFDNAWKKAVNLSNSIRLPKECEVCDLKDLCHSCAAMIYCETGSFVKKPEYRCKMAATLIDSYKKVASEIETESL